jgi:hypothetical protein
VWALVIEYCNIISKKFAPDYSRIAVELKKKGEGYIPLAKVDAPSHEALAQKYGI